MGSGKQCPRPAGGKFMIKRTVIIFIILLASFNVFGEEPGQEKDSADKKAEVFSRIKQASSKIQTLAGEFTQEKHLEILKNAPVSKGKFFYKNPDCLRWEVYEPVSMGFIVNGDKGKRWKGRSGALQSFDLKKEPVIRIISDQVFAWARADFKKLESGYDITIMEEAPVVLKLVPVSITEKKYIAYINLVFSSTEDYVSAIEIHEAGGDSTQINFIDMTINKPLQENIF
jgi:outer membrane lipoprotein-sorting protein